MDRIPMWRATPRGRRLLSDLGAAITPIGRESAGKPDGKEPAGPARVALLVGAGVDAGLSGRPGWQDLIERLALSGKLAKEHAAALRNVAGRWAVESAEALRSTIGLASYQDTIREFVASGTKGHDSPLSSAINALLDAGVQVVVNFNYTADFIEAVRKTDGRRTVRSIERPHLSSWNLKDLLEPPAGNVHVIAIHGFVDSDSAVEPEVVLDRRSYDRVTLETPYYHQLLTRLFQDFTVLSVGMSWTDVPLRSAAAEVLFQFPIAARVHVAIFPHGSPLEDLWQERGLLNSYSVRLLQYGVEAGNDHRQSAQILTSVSVPLPRKDVRRPDDLQMRDIAGFLDEWGDYESGPQCDWMARDGNWERLYDAIMQRRGDLLTRETWLALARIERHLRHFVWFYKAPGIPRSEARKRLWTHVAALRQYVPGFAPTEAPDFPAILASELDRSIAGYDQRGLFEFSLGAFEVPYGRPGGAGQELQRWQAGLGVLAARTASDLLRGRVRVAEQAWLPAGTLSLKALEELRRSAANAEWEGMEAKIALDLAQNRFTSGRVKGTIPRRWDEGLKREILGYAEDARIVARTAGCFRREVGSVVVASFVAPLRSAEESLLAIHERFRANSSRHHELSMLWWIYVGFLAIYCETRRDGTERWREDLNAAREWLVRRVGRIIRTGDHMMGAVTENSIPHWEYFHPEAAKLAMKLAERMNERKG